MPFAVELTITPSVELVATSTLVAGKGLPKEVFAVIVAPLLMMKLPGVEAVPNAVARFKVPAATVVIPLFK